MAMCNDLAQREHSANTRKIRVPHTNWKTTNSSHTWVPNPG